MVAEMPARTEAEGARDTSESNATRYLCVGAEVDEGFGELVIQEVLEERYRAVAPSWGFDLVPVVGHALVARSRRTVGDRALATIELINLLLNPVGTLVTAISWLWIRFTYRTTRQLLPRSHPRYALWTAAIAYLFAVPFLLLLWLGLEVLTRPLSALSDWSALGLGPLGFLVLGMASRTAGALFVGSLLLAWGVLTWEQWAIRSMLVQTLRHASRPIVPAFQYDRRVRERLRAIRESQRDANVTIYSARSPFLGAGHRDRTWSFSIDLTRKSELNTGEKEPGEPTVSQLHAEVKERLHRLAASGQPQAQRFEDLVVEDRLFVSGGAVHDDPRFLIEPDRPPNTVVDPSVVEWVIENPTGSVRHFKCIRLESWSREIALSVFVHMAIHGQTLYVEVAACKLRPIRAWYHLVDRLPKRMIPGERADLLWQTLKDLPASLLRAPVSLLRAWRSTRHQEQAEGALRRQLAEQLPINYGARVSIREAAAADEWHDDFQDLDVHKQLQMVELHVLEAILGRLERHGIETSDVRRSTQATIVNTGILMQGSSISGSTVAGGPGAAAGTGGPATPQPAPGK